MLFQSSLRKELARSFGGTLVVLLTIVITIILIRTLGQATRGGVNPKDVMLVLAYSSLGRLPVVLTLSLFIAMVATLSRMYRDSEMVIWFGSGKGLIHFLPSLFRFAWPTLLAITALSLFAWPWANQQGQALKDRYESRGDLERVAPGQFQESASGNRVFFIDRQSSSAGATLGGNNNVFIASTDKGKLAITTAQSGRIQTMDGTPVLLLKHGQRLESIPGQTALKISRFEEYGSKTGHSQLAAAQAPAENTLSTLALIRQPSSQHQGELAWRLSLALAAINFVIVALALSSMNPRAGRSANLLLVMLTFIVYYNFLNLGQSWISLGSLRFSTFLLALHGTVLALGLGWLCKRHYQWTLPSWSSWSNKHK